MEFRCFEGLRDKDWRAVKVYFDVRLIICRNYDKYADLKPQRLFYEILELLSNLYNINFSADDVKKFAKMKL